jgi:hypothetical protein
LIKELSGYSGSRVLLMRDGDRIFVRKYGQNQRNLERIESLRSLGLQVPGISSVQDGYYDMEYIRHTDMANWLSQNSPDGFIQWMQRVIEQLKRTSMVKDYLPVYEGRLTNPGLLPYLNDLPFAPSELISKLPRWLPSGEYHGDLTMDNCLHGADGNFYLIDPLTTDYDSWVFDLAKLMQDLDCGWFIRDKNLMLHGKLWNVRSALIQIYPEADDPYLLILMLMRVLPYAKGSKDREFLISEIHRLWK